MTTEPVTYDELIAEIERIADYLRNGNPLEIEKRADEYIRAVEYTRRAKEQLKNAIHRVNAVRASDG